LLPGPPLRPLLPRQTGPAPAAMDWARAPAPALLHCACLPSAFLHRAALALRRRPRAPSASPPSLTKCIRGERGCIFTSPLSSEGSLPRPLPLLLELRSSRHSGEREEKLRLPRAVGLSLN